MAIVTSSEPEPFAAVHARAGILHRFELALTRDQYEKAKPDPEPYLRAVERLGVARASCLVIEDSERGLRAAKAAGLTCWIVPSELTRGGRFAEADAVLEDFAAVVHRAGRASAGAHPKVHATHGPDECVHRGVPVAHGATTKPLNRPGSMNRASARSCFLPAY